MMHLHMMLATVLSAFVSLVCAVPAPIPQLPAAGLATPTAAATGPLTINVVATPSPAPIPNAAGPVQSAQEYGISSQSAVTDATPMSDDGCIKYDANGLAPDGLDRQGYNATGWNAGGFGKDGFNAGGRNYDGLDRKGYLANGQYALDKDGYDAQNRNLQNFDRQGFSPEGFDAEGYDRDGFDRHGLNRAGIDRNGNGCTSTSSDSSSSNPEDAAKLGLPPLEDKFGSIPFDTVAFLGTSIAAQIPAAGPTGSRSPA